MTLLLLLFILVGILHTNALVEIKDDTYSTLVADTADESENEVWLIMFYAPWCHHCHKVRPIFEKLAITTPSKVKFGVIDATVNKKSTAE